MRGRVSQARGERETVTGREEMEKERIKKKGHTEGKVNREADREKPEGRGQGAAGEEDMEESAL